MGRGRLEAFSDGVIGYHYHMLQTVERVSASVL